ncbi:MMPL family transporter [Aliidiomarina indica]|uniref:MMPL family transporter n=1 Tax=Aliidiomarina indica TaxID=2749147 RepID=UPI00188EE5BE|nr:hypothetical protein [Aliidiomarina indica]
MNDNKLATVLVLCWAILLAFAALQFPNTQWQSSILSFLPSQEDQLEHQILQKNPTHQHIRLVLRNGTVEEYKSFAQELRDTTNGVDWLNPEREFADLQDTYRAYSGAFISDAQSKQLNGREFDVLIENAWRLLSAPTPIVVSNFTQDPLLLTETAVRARSNPYAGYNVYGFEIADLPPEWMLLGIIAADGLDRTLAQNISTAVQRLEEKTQTQNENFQVLRSGVVFHTAEAATQAEKEINLFGALSLLGVITLMWVCFGRLKPLAVSLGVLFFALTSGFAAVIAVFTEVHLIALVFSTTLIGIAVDYTIHGILAAGFGKGAFQRMLPHLRLGMLTTLLGYLAISLLPFALFQQVAVFIAVGLVAAYAAVHFGLVKFAGHDSFEPRNHVRMLANNYVRQWAKIPSKAIYIVLAFMALVVVLGITQIQFNDDVRKLTRSSSGLLQQELEVQKIGAAHSEAGQKWLLQEGDDLEAMLQEQETLRGTLRTLEYVYDWQMLADQLPSKERQQAALHLQGEFWESESGQHYLNQLGLLKPETSYLMGLEDLTEWQQQLLSEQEDGTYVSFIQLHADLGDAELADLNLPNSIRWFNPLDDAENALSHLRHQLYLWIVIALFVTFLMLMWKRSLSVAFTGILYLAFVLVAALSLSQWFNLYLTVFHLVAAILVLSLAIDYLIFFSAPLEPSYVQLAVAMSAITSLLAFGVLTMSTTPAIAGFGITVLFGILLGSLLAPLFTRMRPKF